MGKSSLAVLLIILGAFMLLYGANVFPMQTTFQPYTVEGKGYIVTVYRDQKHPAELWLRILQSKSVASNTFIYVWVYREAVYRRYNTETKQYDYATTFVSLGGRGGSCKVKPASENASFYMYHATVNFETATVWSPPGYFQNWEFVEWKNKGRISVNDKVWITVDLTAIQNIPAKEPETAYAPEPEPIPPETTPPPPTPPSDAATLNIGVREASPQLQMLGAGMVIAGLALMVMKKKQG